MPEAAEPPAIAPAHPVHKFAREDEVEELLAAMRLPDYSGRIDDAADIAGIDRRRAKDMLRREIAKTVLRSDINGNISATAKALNLPMKTVWNQMQNDGFLKTANGATDPAKHIITMEDTINRAVLSESEMSEMKGLVAQDKALSSFKWDKIGMKDERVGHLLSLEQFAKGSIRSSLDLTHGGLIYCFAEMIDLFKTTKKKFDDGELPVEDTENGPKDNEKEYLYLMASLSAEIRNINTQVQRSQILRIKAAEMELAKRAEGSPSRPKNGKPGFSSGAPPSVLVQVNASKGSEVKVSESKPQ